MHDFAGSSKTATPHASEATSMPWRFDDLAIEPERIRAMRAAYYKACAQLGLSPASDSMTEILVAKIVDLGTARDVDLHRLCQLAVACFSTDPTPAEREEG
jgi:hypothetical protein